jgi:hypothetical protein
VQDQLFQDTNALQYVNIGPIENKSRLNKIESEQHVTFLWETQHPGQATGPVTPVKRKPFSCYLTQYFIKQEGPHLLCLRHTSGQRHQAAQRQGASQAVKFNE